MTKNSENKYPLWMQVSTCLFGLSLYFASYHPDIVSSVDIKNILQQLGVGVLVFGITAFYITHRYNTIASRQISNVSEEIKSLTIEAFDLVKNAKNSGVERIFPLRTGEIYDFNGSVTPNEFRERIQHEFNKLSEIKEKRLVRMVGISFRDFFNDLGLLSDVTEKLMKNENVHFEILLINPFSTQAGYRAEREAKEPYSKVEDHFVSTLFQDIQKCTKNFEKTDSNRIAVRFYSTAPSCMLIFVDQSVFVETYHYGRAGVGGLKGGKIPILEFRKGTHAYEELEGHFDYVWSKAIGCQLTPEFREKILIPRKDPAILKELEQNLHWVNHPECATGCLLSSEMKIDGANK